MSENNGSGLETATFGAGCFWCVESVFQYLKGVTSVTSGYAGGSKEAPTYEEVCSGKTGHAEVVRVVFDPQQVTYDELLEVFWKTHDPTTLNRQGEDVGTQYRSVIFYHNEQQKKKAETYKQKLNEAEIWSRPVVTEITPATSFYEAEAYHQNYFNNHPEQGYCKMVIQPKVEKFRQLFANKLRS